MGIDVGVLRRDGRPRRELSREREAVACLPPLHLRDAGRSGTELENRPIGKRHHAIAQPGPYLPGAEAERARWNAPVFRPDLRDLVGFDSVDALSKAVGRSEERRVGKECRYRWS